MLIIRLQRIGSKNKPDYHIVLAEKHRAAAKKAVEILGEYNPRSKKFVVSKEERLKTWLSRNVELSPTVHNLLVSNKYLQAKKVKAWTAKAKEGAKTESAPVSPAKEPAKTEAQA